MQADPTAVAARNLTVPGRGAEHDETQPVCYADLAETLATDGPVALHSELRSLIREARRHGVTPLLVTILADPSQPDVARQRAFGRILAELERPLSARPAPLGMSLWASTADWRMDRRRQSAAAAGPTRVTCPGARTRREP